MIVCVAIDLVLFICFFVVACSHFDFVFSVPRDWWGRVSPKWPILCQMGH